MQGGDPLASLIARAALAREETRGCHVRSDMPELDGALEHRHLMVAADARPMLVTWA